MKPQNGKSRIDVSAFSKFVNLSTINFSNGEKKNVLKNAKGLHHLYNNYNFS